MTTERVINPADPANTSESEEMYLITVARAAEDGRTGPVPVAMLAEHLGVSVASTNEMVRKLAARDLLTYEPYRGVELTPLGARVSERVLRTRRLWSTFLANHLGLSPTEADDQACLLEHVTMPEATERLAAALHQLTGRHPVEGEERLLEAIDEILHPGPLFLLRNDTPAGALFPEDDSPGTSPQARARAFRMSS